MTSRVGTKGQVVIPKRLRDQLGFEPGDEVTFAVDDGAVRIARRADEAPLRGLFRGAGLLAELEEDHRRERER